MIETRKGFTPTLIIAKLPKAKRKAHRNDWCRGFTLIEIVIVMAVSIFIITGFFSVYSNFNKGKSFEFAVQGVVNLLKEAKSNTLASKNASVYGVHLETGRAVLFKGDTFSEPSADNREYTMPADVELSNIDLNGGGSDIIFNRLTGETQQFGTTTVSRVSDVTVTKDIVVSQTGVVEY